METADSTVLIGTSGYDYSEKESASFVPVIQNATIKVKKGHVFFNNHPNGNSAKNAQKLKKML